MHDIRFEYDPSNKPDIMDIGLCALPFGVYLGYKKWKNSKMTDDEVDNGHNL